MMLGNQARGKPRRRIWVRSYCGVRVQWQQVGKEGKLGEECSSHKNSECGIGVAH